MDVETSGEPNGVLYALAGFSGDVCCFLKDGMLCYEFNLFEIDRTKTRSTEKITTSWSILMNRFLVVFLFAMSGSLVAGAEEPIQTGITEIADAIQGYVKDFNGGDANAIAERWTQHGRMIDDGGNVTEGRDQLRSQLTAYFAEVKDAKLSVDVMSIDLISPSVAREVGVATVLVPGSDPEITDYVAIHVRTDGRWQLDSVTENNHIESAPSSYENLKNLGRMIGTWHAGNDESSITTTCRWSKNRNFLIRSFKVDAEGQESFEGTQVVGWDPINEAIRSWTFDSDGGYAAGQWSEEGDRWLENSKSILPDGRVGSETHIFSFEDDDSISYQAIARQVDDELLPSIGPVKVSRSE